MTIHVLPSGPIQTNGYLLTDAARGEAVLIDAPGDILDEIRPVLAKEGCKLTELWITHGHWDHTQDAAKVVRATGAKVLAHAADKTLIETPQVMSAFLGGSIKLEPVKVDRWVKQGERFNALGLEVEVRHILPEELAGFSECFLCGSAAEITPVSEIGDYRFTPGELSLGLMEDYGKLVRGEA